MTNYHRACGIHLLGNTFLAAMITTCRLVEWRRFRFIPGKDIATIAVSAVCQVHQLIADPL